jgi:hypothetical protein
MANYATTAELVTFLGTAAPADATRLLTRATEDIDYVIRRDLDDLTVEPYLSALKNACCAQVEMMIAGDENIGARSVKSYTSGKTSVTYGGGDGGTSPVIARRAYQFLARAGLLYRKIRRL